ncbi:metallophosphoesterase [Roseomonas sp. BN140053]|uniref:metallophosphoesterase n=1 Tax=Roseomonas sp. BN140053 TaxID=3391898 RepID=UPI0039EC029B
MSSTRGAGPSRTVVDCTRRDPVAFEQVYAVGDVHGRLDLLAALEGRILADARRRRLLRWAVCYLGDYVDRGPDSRGVLDRLCRNPLGLPAQVFLAGNHEDSMQAFLDGQTDGISWMQFGGIATLASYGLAFPDTACPDTATLRNRLRARMPPRHRAFLSSLRACFRWNGFLLVHAGVMPDRPLKAQRRRDLTTIREPFLSAPPGGVLVVHGHTVQAEPVLRPGRLGIDTGAYLSGRLTAALLGAGEIAFLST